MSSIFLIEGHAQFHLEVSKDKGVIFSHLSSQTLWGSVDPDQKPWPMGLRGLLSPLPPEASLVAHVDNVVHTYHPSLSEEAEPNSEPCLKRAELRKSE